MRGLIVERARLLALLIPVLGVGLIAAACSGSPTPAAPAATSAPKSGATSAPAAPAASSSTGGKTIVLAFSDGGTTLDPYQANDLTSDTLDLAIYDNLVQLGKKTVDGKTYADDTKIEPMLAESWTKAPDGKSYTFNLRKGVKFQNGDPFNADAVKFSFEKLLKDGASGKFLFDTAAIDTSNPVQVIDDNTVKINLTRPNPTFLQVISLYAFAIVNPKVLAGKTAGYLAKNADGTGTGAYKLVSWNPATEADFVANKDYWGGAPKVDKIIIKFIKEDATRLMMLQSGDVDMAIEIPPKDVDTLKSNSNLVVRSDPSGRILYFLLNNKVKPFDNPKVRQALSYAVPYDDLINKVMNGQAKQLKSPCPSFMPMYDPSGWNYKYDLDTAKKLLAEAGYPNGFSFDFVLGSGFSDWEQDAVLIQASFAKIGVKMNIQNMARSEFLQVIKKKETPAFISKWTSFVNDPGYHLGFLLQSDGSSNYGNYSNPVVDKDLAEAKNEQDPAKRAQLYGQAQQQIEKDAPWIDLYEYNRIIAYNKDLKGYAFYVDELIRLRDLSK